MSSPPCPLVWYLILDSATGNPCKESTPSTVSLPPGSVIDQFRKAVCLESSSILTGITSSQLRVYKNKAAFDKRNDLEGKEEPLEEDALIQNLGSSKKEALIVAVNFSASLSVVPIPDRLRQLGVQFSIRDINYLLNNEIGKYSMLKSPDLTFIEAQTIITSAKSKIKSATQKAIGLQYSYFLDGSLNVGQGQTKSSLYYAFSESAGVLVAKVYNGHKDDFMREVETDRALDHKNLVKFIKSLSIQNDARHIIIMPFFPRSVADLLSQQSEIPLVAIKIIARNCFDALCHLHSKGLCFADLKPSNIMLHNTEPGYATLVDYAAAVRIGSPIIEFTESYCLDADKITATEHLDWICLGTTLAQIGGFEIYNYNRAFDVVNEVLRSSKSEYFKNLIVACLQNPSSAKIESALNQKD